MKISVVTAILLSGLVAASSAAVADIEDNLIVNVWYYIAQPCSE